MNEDIKDYLYFVYVLYVFDKFDLDHFQIHSFSVLMNIKSIHRYDRVGEYRVNENYVNDRLNQYKQVYHEH